MDDNDANETTGFLSNKTDRKGTIQRRFHIENNSGENSLNMVVIIEDLRAAFYLSFIFVLLVGIVLTYVFVDEDHNAILTKVFGISNLCSYVDFAPTTYIIPALWCFSIIFIFLYTAAAIFRIKIAYLEKKLSKCACVLLVLAHVYVFLSAIFFTLSFSVQPDPAKPVTMLIHTSPYVNMKITFAVLQVAVVYFGVKVSWKGLNLPRWFHIMSVAHVVPLIIVEVAGSLILINALADMGENLEGNGLWWSVRTEANKIIAQWIGNILAFVLHTVFPLFQSLYICRNGVDSHALIVAVNDNRVSAYST